MFMVYMLISGTLGLRNKGLKPCFTSKHLHQAILAMQDYKELKASKPFNFQK